MRSRMPGGWGWRRCPTIARTVTGTCTRAIRAVGALERGIGGIVRRVLVEGRWRQAGVQVWVVAQVEGDVAAEREGVEVVELGDAEVELEVAVEVEGVEGAEGEGEGGVVKELRGLADWEGRDCTW